MKLVEYCAKLDEVKMKRILNGDATIKEFESYSGEITKRFIYIVEQICSMQGAQTDWFDYSNEGGDLGPAGYFDPNRYKEETRYIGVFKNDSKRELYCDCFPTSWFWEDFEDTLAKEISDYKKEQEEKKNREKNNKISREERNKALIASALAKLTPEEAKAMGYRKPKS